MPAPDPDLVSAAQPSLHAAARAARRERDQRLAQLDFDRAPFTIAWELTRACAYACLHCRADAQPRRDPRELDTNEALALVDKLAGFANRPILVLTGGDPLMRRDIFELAARASERGLRVSLTPTATALPTQARMLEARAASLCRVPGRVNVTARPPPAPRATRRGRLMGLGECSDGAPRCA